MEGVLPLSLSLSDDSARIVGAYVRLGLVDVVRPPLDSINLQLQSANRVLRLMTLAIVDSAGQLQQARLRVQVINEDLLDHIEATRWAVAYLSYNTFLELLGHVSYMRWLDGRSHIHLHDIIAGLVSVEGAIAALAAELTFIGDTVVRLLQAILDQLQKGIGLSGQIQIVVSTGGLGDFLKTLDLWKLLGLLGILTLGLALIVLFLYGVGAALATFSGKAMLAAITVGILVAALVPLISTLAGFDWMQLLKIAAGFAGIAGFVWLLGRAFATITADLDKIVPQLNAFFGSIGKLISTLAGLDWMQLLKIAAGFAGIAGFVWLLGRAFATITADLDKIVPQLNAFFGSIGKLISTLAGLDWMQLLKIAAGFAGIAGFVWLLGRAFATITADLDKIVPQLNAFFGSIGKLISTLAGLDWMQLLKIAAGFAGIAGFVWLLGRALATLTEKAIGALPKLADFFAAITRLMSVIASFSVGQLVAIAAGFLLIAGFVWGLSMALGTFTQQAIDAMPGLVQLLAALGSLAQLMAGMSAGEMVTMGIGLALIALFVWAVAAALRVCRRPAQGPRRDIPELRQSAQHRLRHRQRPVGRPLRYRQRDRRRLRCGQRRGYEPVHPDRPQCDLCPGAGQGRCHRRSPGATSAGHQRRPASSWAWAARGRRRPCPGCSRSRRAWAPISLFASRAGSTSPSTPSGSRRTRPGS